MNGQAKAFRAAAAVAILALGVAGCSSERASDPDASNTSSECGTGGLVGISMPTRSLERWIRDGDHLSERLDEKGYDVDLQYADNKVDQQIAQLQNMINSGARELVVAPIDGSSLGPILDKAKAADIKVISYDRMIRDAEGVDYIAGFDNYTVGEMQGTFIEDALGLKDGEGPYNFEPFSGSPDDPNAALFFEGAWDVLQPYIEKGQLEVPSGKAPETADDWQSIGIQAWMAPAAQAEMETRLNSFYVNEKVDAVLAPNDALALGIAQALSADEYAAGEWPELTGQDADLANVRAILEGKQSMTVWKDSRALGDQVAEMVDQIGTCSEVEVTDEGYYDNGSKLVDAYLLEPKVITKDNVESELVDSGFYSKEDLGI